MKHKFCLILLIFLIKTFCFAQNKVFDKRENSDCYELKKVLGKLPKEFNFGTYISSEGEVRFMVSDRTFLKEIFVNPTDGVAIDVVSNKIYDCKNPNYVRGSLKNGVWTKIIYRDEILKKMKDSTFLSFGKIQGFDFEKEELEGNLILIKDGSVCHYQSFIHVDESLWDLLPMGLFTDDELNQEGYKKDTNSMLYSKKLSFTIPFQKNKYEYKPEDIKALYDSLKLKDFIIKRIEIRAYTSIEGDISVNEELQLKRANSILNGLQKYQKLHIETNILTAENWMDFYRDIEGTKLDTLAKYKENDIRSLLKNKKFLTAIEPILQKHRKGIINLYLEKKTNLESLENATVIAEFKKNIAARNARKAVVIQKEIFKRISDKKMPFEFLNKLEVPNDRYFSIIQNDRTVFALFEEQADGEVTLSKMQKIAQIDPNNPKIKYNLIALKLRFGKLNEADFKVLFEEIKDLRRLEIDNSLVRRMLMNYHIRKADFEMKRKNYVLKDQSLNFIVKHYLELSLTDDDLLALSKFMSYYSLYEMAKVVLKPRLDKIDVNEAVLFHYINLLFLESELIKPADYEGVIRNAIIINRKRYCDFFKSNDDGGASFQLLEDSQLRRLYCENCK